MSDLLDIAVLTAELERLVRVESPSDDPDALAASAAAVAQLGRHRLGADPELIEAGGRPHLRWRLGADDGPRVLLLGHHDTVWPIGSWGDQVWTVRDGLASGPGCLDMKSGVVQMFHVAALLPPGSAVTLLITGDEELGAPGSRPLIEQAAREAGHTLVFEAAADGGALKTARKGAARYEITAHGLASHAGLAPHAGVNATVELGLQLPHIVAMDGGPEGTTVTPTRMRAGTTGNTVPAEGSLVVDVRAVSLADQQRVHDALHALRPRLPGARLEVRSGPSHPPLEAASTAALFGLAEQAALQLGIERPVGAAVGGASDGNIAAAAGSLVLDGLGGVGGGAHAAGEYVQLDQLVARTRLAAAVVERVLAARSTDRDGR